MGTVNRRAFISYSHDSEEHKEWVCGLATYLREKGIDAVLDKWDLSLGDDLSAFMEANIRDTDRVIVVSTNQYIEKANAGIGGVGYEKRIVTAELLRDAKARRKFIPVVRNVEGPEKLPTFFGAALYLDLSEAKDNEAERLRLVEALHEVVVTKPPLGVSPFISQTPAFTNEAIRTIATKRPSWNAHDGADAFSERFAQAFPGMRGIQWFSDQVTIAERLEILLKPPLLFLEGHLAWWWRGPRNLQIENFSHVEGSHFLMDFDELNIRKIAAVNSNIYYRSWIYVEADADEPTGLYSTESIAWRIKTFGYADEEYGLVDEKLPVTRAEYDDGAALINGKPHDIRGRVTLRTRFLSTYNFIIAPFSSPINNHDFDYDLEAYLNKLIQGEDVFDEMAAQIERLPKRN